MERTPRKISVLNDIHRPAITKLVDEGYFVRGDYATPDVILLRSADIRSLNTRNAFKRLKAVGRVGVGVNNIPVDELTKIGVPVFNTPGANSNAVAELTIGSMIMAGRNILKALDFVRDLQGTDVEIKAKTELSKRAFNGTELTGRTLGVVGLGAIGRKVAKMAIALGMKVTGYDPYLDANSLAELSKSIHLTDDIHTCHNLDYLSFHIPPDARMFTDFSQLAHMKGTVVLNFSRDEVLDTNVLLDGLKYGNISCYVTDFPNARLKEHERVITLPHIGASTTEAKENCAFMIVDQITDFLENGNIRNSVNFPEAIAPQIYNHRIVVANKNIPSMITQISGVIASAELNIETLTHSSKDGIAYSIIDVNDAPPDSVRDVLLGLNGVLMVRIIR